jgi:hypothetical protein
MKAKKAHIVTVEDFKEVMRNGMLENFKRYGFLTPVAFVYLKEGPQIMRIPNEMLKSTASKTSLAQSIKALCIDPKVLSAGIVMEAYGAKININSDNAKKVLAGEMRVSELAEREDVIVLIYSTPEKDESIVYSVDCKEKTVGEAFTPEDAEPMIGIFGNFFELRK